MTSFFHNGAKRFMKFCQLWCVSGFHFT